MNQTLLTNQLGILNIETTSNTFEEKCQVLETCMSSSALEPQWGKYTLETELYETWLCNQNNW